MNFFDLLSLESFVIRNSIFLQAVFPIVLMPQYFACRMHGELSKKMFICFSLLSLKKTLSAMSRKPDRKALEMCSFENKAYHKLSMWGASDNNLALSCQYTFGKTTRNPAPHYFEQTTTAQPHTRSI